MYKEIENKIGQLQYEISCLGLDKEELTGVSIRTEELKDLLKINFIDSSLQLKDKEEMTFKEFEKTFTKRTIENETFYETEQGLKAIEDISYMYDKYLDSL